MFMTLFGIHNRLHVHFATKSLVPCFACIDDFGTLVLPVFLKSCVDFIQNYYSNFCLVILRRMPSLNKWFDLADLSDK
jgi:hypothetical protein